MITFSLFTFLALLEGIVALLIVIGVLVWRQRKARTQDRIAYIDGSDTHPTPALYLESEVAKTRTHLESLTTDIIADPAQTALSLRAALLEVEAELSHSLPEQRDQAFWQSLADRLGNILTTTGYSRESAVEDLTVAHAAEVEIPADKVYLMGVEGDSVTGLVEQQSKTIDFLRNYIHDLLDQHGHKPLPEPNIAGKFDELEHANKELSDCVQILEDENEFLREQIAALLKLD